MQLKGNVLFVGAHADDIELFAGGLLSRRSAKLEGENHCLTFSAHKGITNSVQAMEEHITNMRSLGMGKNFEIMDWDACKGQFQENRDIIYRKLDAAITKNAINCIVTHPVDTNQDHQQVREEVLRVAKGRCSIITGEYPFNQIHGRMPDIFVKLTQDDIDTKISLIENYASQQREGRHYFDPDVWLGLARLRGAMIGTQYAEGFYTERLVLD